MTTGEGSRGGKIIRHTKGGYAVYSGHAAQIKKIAIGGAVAAAGVATAIFAGKQSAHILQNAALVENKARGFASQYRRMAATAGGIQNANAFERQALKSVGHQALGAAVASTSLARTAFGLRTVGTVASTALVAAGTNKALKKDNETRSDKIKRVETVGVAAGATAAFALRTSYYKSLGIDLKAASTVAARKVYTGLRK